MLLTISPEKASAFENPSDTDYWVGLTRTQVVNMLDRITTQTETRDVVLVCYPLSDTVFNAIKQFSDYANKRGMKLYYYACANDSSDASRIDNELAKLLTIPSDQSQPDWPVAITYNTSTKKVLAQENVGTLTAPIGGGINGLLDLMQANNVSSGSAGADPDESETPANPNVPVVPVTPIPEGMDAKSWEVLRLLNQYRMSIDLQPLSSFDALQDVANLRAQEIYVSYRSNHTRPDNSICWTAYQECHVLYHYSAENIASGQPTSAIVMDSWYHSPGHRRNMESTYAVHVGVGHYYGTQPSAGADNWTQDFAAANNCRFNDLQLSTTVIYGKQGADLETLLTNANVIATANCYRHGSCRLPLIAAMCSGYDKNASGEQIITATYGGQTAQLTIITAHNWNDGELTKAPTCVEEGTKIYTCLDTNCSATKTEIVPATGHRFADHSLFCADCETTLADTVGDSLSTHLVQANETVWTENDAKQYAEELVHNQLQDMEQSQVNVAINPINYIAPQNGTPDLPEGIYGQLDYTVTISTTDDVSSNPAMRNIEQLSVTSQSLRLTSNAQENTTVVSPVLRLDIMPLTDEPINSYDHAHIITFDANGGQVSPSAMTSEKNGTLSVLPTPNRTGYHFKGWYLDSDSKTQVTTNTVFDGDQTIVAQWQTIAADSGYGGDGGDYTVDSTDTVTTAHHVNLPSVIGGVITIAPKSATKGTLVTINVLPDEGYELASLTVSDKNGKSLALHQQDKEKYTFTMIDSDVSITAAFQIIKETTETIWHNPFIDVATDAWYYDAVRFVAENGLMNGCNNDTFDPDINLSRGMLAQILYNKEGNDDIVVNNNVFSDVAEDAWYAQAIAWAANKGIVSGYGNGLFGPEDAITREQFASILWRYDGAKAAINNELHFDDANEVSDYAQKAMCWAVENGIINGYTLTTLNPKGQTTRAQAAQMLKNYYAPNE